MDEGGNTYPGPRSQINKAEKQEVPPGGPSFFTEFNISER